MLGFLILFGFSSGIMVGSGVIAILILVGLVPRMSSVSNTTKYISIYEMLLIIGTFIGSILSLSDFNIEITPLILLILGLCYGIFVGFLSSGLTEILDYIPVVSRRLKIPIKYLKYIIIALLLGKVLGSLIGSIII